MSQWIVDTPLFAGAQGVTSGARKNLQIQTNNQSTGPTSDAGPQESTFNPEYQPHFNNYIPREVVDFERYSLLNNSTSIGPGENGPKITSAGGFQPKNYHGVFAKAR